MQKELKSECTCILHMFWLWLCYHWQAQKNDKCKGKREKKKEKKAFCTEEKSFRNLTPAKNELLCSNANAQIQAEKLFTEFSPIVCKTYEWTARLVLKLFDRSTMFMFKMKLKTDKLKDTAQNFGHVYIIITLPCN